MHRILLSQIHIPISSSVLAPHSGRFWANLGGTDTVIDTYVLPQSERTFRPFDLVK